MQPSVTTAALEAWLAAVTSAHDAPSITHEDFGCPLTSHAVSHLVDACGIVTPNVATDKDAASRIQREAERHNLRLGKIVDADGLYAALFALALLSPARSMHLEILQGLPNTYQQALAELFTWVTGEVTGKGFGDDDSAFKLKTGVPSESAQLMMDNRSLRRQLSTLRAEIDNSRYSNSRQMWSTSSSIGRSASGIREAVLENDSYASSMTREQHLSKQLGQLQESYAHLEFENQDLVASKAELVERHRDAQMLLAQQAAEPQGHDIVEDLEIRLMSATQRISELEKVNHHYLHKIAELSKRVSTTSSERARSDEEIEIRRQLESSRHETSVLRRRLTAVEDSRQTLLKDCESMAEQVLLLQAQIAKTQAAFLPRKSSSRPSSPEKLYRLADELANAQPVSLDPLLEDKPASSAEESKAPFPENRPSAAPKSPGPCGRSSDLSMYGLDDLVKIAIRQRSIIAAFRGRLDEQRNDRQTKDDQREEAQVHCPEGREREAYLVKENTILAQAFHDLSYKMQQSSLALQRAINAPRTLNTRLREAQDPLLRRKT
ncbi:hypothetical protein PYCC9005_002618 [Savitreella phatthalungensis]